MLLALQALPDRSAVAEPGVFPNFEFARALKPELAGDTGTVFMWSHHKNTILNRIMLQLDESLSPPADADTLKLIWPGWWSA
jgi:hypothetical protein